MEHLNKIKNTLKNLRKTPNRIYKKQTILKKLKEVEDEKLKINETLSKTKDTSETNNIRTEFNRIYILTKEALEAKLKEGVENTEEENSTENEEENSNTESKERKMPPNDPEPFNVLQYMKAIPEFTGKFVDADKFINIIKLIASTIPANHKPPLYQLILNTKIPNNIKTKLSVLGDDEDINKLITNLKIIYKTKKTPNSVLDQISKTHQGQLSTQKYIEKIESLISELNNIQIEQMGSEHRNSIIKINDTIAFNALRKGLNNQSTVQTIDASRVTTFLEASNIARETEITNNNNTIMYFQGRYNNNRQSNNRQPHRQQPNYADNRNTQNNAYNSNNYNRSTNNYNRNFSNYNRNYNRNNNNNYNRNNYNNNNRKSHNFNNRNINNNHKKNNSRNYNNAARRVNIVEQNDTYEVLDQGNSYDPGTTQH